MPYAILRIAKLKKSNVGGSGSHVSRSRTTPNADQSKLEDNQTLIHSGDQYLPLAEVVAAKIANFPQKRKIRTDAVHAVEFLLSASPEYFRPQNPADYGNYDQERLDRWQQETVNWLRSKYGDKIVRAELHLDEATPHIHAYLVPLDEQQQLNCRGIFGNKFQMIALQDSYAAAMKPLGLERGIRGSTAEHTSIREYYTTVNQYVVGGMDSVIANLQAENAQLTSKLRESIKEANGLRTERDDLRQKLDDREIKVPTKTKSVAKRQIQR